MMINDLKSIFIFSELIKSLYILKVFNCYIIDKIGKFKGIILKIINYF